MTSITRNVPAGDPLHPGHREFWLRHLTKGLAASRISHDFRIGEMQTCEIGHLPLLFEAESAERLLQISDRDPMLVLAMLCCNLGIMLYKYTGDNKVLFGLPSLKETGRLNVLPYVIDIEAEANFAEWVEKVYIRLEEIYEHGDEDFDELETLLRAEGGEDVPQLYDIVLELQNIHFPLPEVKGSINFRLNMREDRLTGEICYKKAFFREDTICGVGDWFLNVLRNCMQQTRGSIAQIDMLPDSEMRRLRVVGNGAYRNLAGLCCNHELFELQAGLRAEKAALVCGDKSLTYGELDLASDDLATTLRSAGIRTDALVGIYTDRSFEMVTAVLGILKAGAAYVPFDPTYPADRIDRMLHAAGLEVILTQRKYEKLLHKMKSELKIVVLDDREGGTPEKRKPESRTSVCREDLAYVIFTSGSTGTPKCAGVFQKGWSNLLHWFREEFGICATDRSLLISSFGFDITQRTLMMPLISGAELHLYNRLVYDPEDILGLIESRGITILNCTPSTFYPLVELFGEEGYKKLRSLRYLFLGGEPIVSGRLKGWAASALCRCDIVNVYGVTECSDVSSYYVLREFDRYDRSGVPIGKPIFNTELLVLNENLDPVPAGMEGELLIGGEGVGKGYVNDVELTEKKFIEYTADGVRRTLYRTGDMVKLRPDGVLVYAGRRDFQVKIRGHRVDLGEVESQVNSHPLVKEAVVLVAESVERGKELHCYLMATGGGDGQEPGNDFLIEMWKWLRERLPSFMVPDYYRVMKQMPLTPNGKLDRIALRKIPVERIQGRDRDAVLPVGEMEEYIHGLFKKVLNLAEVDVTYGFFDMGGHSLTATQLVAQINQDLQVHLRVVDIISRATVRKLAAHLKGLKGELREGVLTHSST